jgi:UDP-N-acetylglucosamine acyltransferase
MPTQVHPQALVARGAQLDDDVTVGPFAVIGDKVKIKKGTQVGSFCVIENDVTVGENCKIFTGAVIGSIPQDLKYNGEPTAVLIGDNNIIREYVTINLSTDVARPTTVESNNLIMAYSHVAHDCAVGSNCIIANGGTLAGHVTLEDRVVIGGLTAVHQFVRMGTLCIVGGCSKVVTDLPPYTTCDGHPARYYGLNLVGLKRSGMKPEVIRDIKAAYKLLFQSGHTKQHAIDEIRRTISASAEIERILLFLSTSSRGICH